MVPAYADGEVGGLRKHWIEKHLRGCPECAAKHREILALRARLRAQAPYFAAPPGLRERVRAAVGNTPAPRARAPRERSRWLGIGALAGCAATVLAFVVSTSVLELLSGRDIAEGALATHVSATLGNRLVAVASSDGHTVKPWLSARLDYSPPVLDLAAEGYTLVGGRLDTLDGRPVATLVYRYRAHTIDVFVRPEPSNAPALRSLRGFNVAHARTADWDWIAVSDVSADVLTDLVRKLARDAALPAGDRR
jgi:anti-sigma factor RsiW